MKRKVRKALCLMQGFGKYNLLLIQPVMLFYKDVGKLKAQWRGPVLFRGYGGSYGVSYTLKQFNGRNIRGLFPGNHLRPSVPQGGYLSNPTTDPVIFKEQTIRAPRVRNKKRPTPSSPVPIPPLLLHKTVGQREILMTDGERWAK